MEGHLHVVLNPAAGRGLAQRQWERLEPLLVRDGQPYHLSSTHSPEEVGPVMEKAGQPGCRCILIIGGDGSIHHALNAWIQMSQPAAHRPPLTLLPAGSGNDWATYWRLPRGVPDWWAAFRGWSEQVHHAGRIELHATAHTRYFLNVAGMAYDGWLVHAIESAPGGKGSRLVYPLSVLKGLWRYAPQPAGLRVGSEQYTGRFYTVNAGICPYSGGGMRIVPHARHDLDGLALTMAGALPMSRVLANLWRFYHGSIGRVKGVTTLIAPRLEAHPLGDTPWHIEADGEYLGCGSCTITHVPDAFRVWAPARPHR